MVTITIVPPAPRQYYVEKQGRTLGHIEQLEGKFQFMPTTIYNTRLTAKELTIISDFLTELNNGRS